MSGVCDIKCIDISKKTSSNKITSLRNKVDNTFLDDSSL